jgi:mRNA interferase RelE/StbE
MVDPLKFGLPLKRNLMGLMKLRVGDYRIIYSIQKEVVTVHIIKIGYRKEVYKKS